MFRFAVLFAATLLMTGAAQAFYKPDLKKLKALNGCEGCDLTGADLAEVHLEYVNLKGANFAGADLTGVNLKDAYSITGAKLCKTKTPWGVDNTGCKKK